MLNLTGGGGGVVHPGCNLPYLLHQLHNPLLWRSFKRANICRKRLSLSAYIHRAWRDPLFRIVRRLSRCILKGSPAVGEKCTLAFLLLSGFVMDCHFDEWITVGDLLAHLVRSIDFAWRARTKTTAKWHSRRPMQ